jgi:16S rRNA (cytosine967-C5)-methyltransferase
MRGPSSPRQHSAADAGPAGLQAREAAVRLLTAVLAEGHSLDGALAKEFQQSALEPRDRALARLIATTVLRRLGQLEALLHSYLEKPLPKKQGALWPILLSAAAQLLFLDTPPHAAVGLAVEQARRDRQAGRYDKLVNALLRRAGREGRATLEKQDAVALNIPSWLLQRWISAYGEGTARRIAEASLSEAPLDISVKSDAEAWAAKLGGGVLPTGSIRLSAGGRVDAMPGFEEGAWWVQDAGAALPARLLGDVAGRSIADLCAAPGGKTAQLAAAGAKVTSIDLSAARMQRLKSNLERLKLDAELVEADAGTWSPGGKFDAVLLDAPCTATGTIRRHPDILRLKRPEDAAALAEIQSRLLNNAAELVAPGGTLLYCTCSLEPEEGPAQIERFLSAHPQFERHPIAPGESGIAPECLNEIGDLRTLPFHLPGAEPALSGVDGFYVARLVLRR